MLKIYKVTVSRSKSVCTQTASMWIPRLVSDFASSILSNPVRLLQAKRIRNSSMSATIFAWLLFIYYVFNQYKLHIPKQHADDFLLCNCSCKFRNLRPSLRTQGRYILLYLNRSTLTVDSKHNKNATKIERLLCVQTSPSNKEHIYIRLKLILL